MKRSCTLLLALVAAGLSTSGEAAKPDKCSPQLLAPTGLTVETDGDTVTSTWNEVNDLAREASRYAVEFTAHYDGHGDVRFTFTTWDGDPGELDTASLSIPASGLDTEVCNDPPACGSTTTYSPGSATVQVRALTTVKKGKEPPQCNPFSAPLVASLVPECPCFDAEILAWVASNGGGMLHTCRADYFNSGDNSHRWSSLVLFDDNSAEGAFATSIVGNGRSCGALMGYALAEDLDLTEGEFETCTSLIEAAQSTVGCVTCEGESCPP